MCAAGPAPSPRGAGPVPVPYTYREASRAPRQSGLLRLPARPRPPLTLAFDRSKRGLRHRAGVPGTARAARRPERSEGRGRGRRPTTDHRTGRCRKEVHRYRPGDTSPRRPPLDARGYVWSDCTSDEPEAYADCRALSDAVRAALHDERAAELEARPDRGLLLGAIPGHRERGADPYGVGRRALRAALELCMAIGYSEATADLGMRGRALCDPDADAQDCCHFTAKAASALVPLGRLEEASPSTGNCAAEPEHPRAHPVLALLLSLHRAEIRQLLEQPVGGGLRRSALRGEPGHASLAEPFHSGEGREGAFQHAAGPRVSCIPRLVYATVDRVRAPARSAATHVRDKGVGVHPFDRTRVNTAPSGSATVDRRPLAPSCGC
ncbi:hypothetical protein GCM10010289_49480 [Streptomyces violascens]|uniref:Uncharacterized protein n=1 Tax=Streptomyces violascens TaxID=67381 RepID=A0ABQ3QYM6_9ACTN|nr:hypothetical protein GCM10010289_49480 [Streptomyces violascens]GHI42387.1 hypothetical protein Sviol_67950 [Streptomyces violascens]